MFFSIGLLPPIHPSVVFSFFFDRMKQSFSPYPQLHLQLLTTETTSIEKFDFLLVFDKTSLLQAQKRKTNNPKTSIVYCSIQSESIEPLFQQQADVFLLPSALHELLLLEKKHPCAQGRPLFSHPTTKTDPFSCCVALDSCSLEEQAELFGCFSQMISPPPIQILYEPELPTLSLEYLQQRLQEKKISFQLLSFEEMFCNVEHCWIMTSSSWIRSFPEWLKKGSVFVLQNENTPETLAWKFTTSFQSLSCWREFLFFWNAFSDLPLRSQRLEIPESSMSWLDLFQQWKQPSQQPILWRKVENLLAKTEQNTSPFSEKQWKIDYKKLFQQRKEAQNKTEELIPQLSLWKKRLELAKRSEKMDLETLAQKQMAKLQEELELQKTKTELLEEKWKTLLHQKPSSLAFSSQREVESSFQALEVEQELQKLKQQQLITPELLQKRKDE